MLRFFAALGAMLIGYLPSLIACEGCKEPSSVAGDSGVGGISASFSWSVVFMLGMLAFLLTGMIFMIVRSCRQLAEQQQQVGEASRFAPPNRDVSPTVFSVRGYPSSSPVPAGQP